MENPFELNIQKPVSDWFSNIKIDRSGLFKGLGKIIIDGATINWSALGKDFIDVSSSIKSNPSIHDKTFIFLYKSLCRACVEMYRDHQSIFYFLDTTDKQVLNDRFDVDLGMLDFKIEIGFFQDPSKDKFIINFCKLFEEWSIEYGIEKRKAKQLTQRLPNYFYISLVNEWRENEVFYEPIIKFLQSSPFVNFWQDKQGYRNYLNDISKPYLETVMGDLAGMTLADIYVEPEISSYEWVESKTENGLKKVREFVGKGSCHEKLNAWITNSCAEDNQDFDQRTLIVLGYPGQGKTSLCYRLLHDFNIYASENEINKRLYFLKFRDVIDVSQLLADPFAVIHQNIEDNLGKAIERFKLQNSTILLDGMDELYMKEGLDANDIDVLLGEFNRLTDKFEELRFIITSRYGYIDLEKIRMNNTNVISLDGFSTAKQIEWLDKYNIYHETPQLSETLLSKINKSKSKHLTGIKELINQPILLHLVASSDVDIENVSNRAQIYNQLFETIVERNWDKNGQIKNLTGLTQKSLRRFLQELAIHIYLSDFEYARKSELEKRDYVKNFLDKLANSGIKESLKGIMIAFYLNETRKKEDDFFDEKFSFAIEFLHKSLQEYLVAEKIWNTFRYLAESWEGDFHIDSTDKVINLLKPLTNKKILSTEVRSYLVEIINSDADSTKVFDRLEYFFPELLAKFFTSKSDPCEINYGLALFYLFWTVLKNTSPVPFKLVGELDLHWSGIGHDFSNMVVLFKAIHFGGFDFSNVHFENLDFVGTHFLTDDSFQDSTLVRCNFHRTVLMTSFENSKVINCSFDLARLEGCNLSNADLESTHFSGAVFSSCDFTEAINISAEDLESVHALHNPIGMNEKILETLRSKSKHIFSSYYEE